MQFEGKQKGGNVIFLSKVVWEGATAAFCGKVTAVKPAVAKQKDTLTHFTVQIDYYDYISRGKFGRQSKVGESIDQRVLKLGSV